MKIFFKLLIILGLFLLLVLVRFFEDKLFYDPLIAFYESDFKTKPPPVFDEWQLILNTIFRFWLNSLISLVILFIAFQKKSILNFSFYFYVLAFLILILPFSWLVFNLSPDYYFTLFYIRRFLIHPLFILLLLPAFYYQNHIQRTQQKEGNKG